MPVDRVVTDGDREWCCAVSCVLRYASTVIEITMSWQCRYSSKVVTAGVSRRGLFTAGVMGGVIWIAQRRRERHAT